MGICKNGAHEFERVNMVDMGAEFSQMILLEKETQLSIFRHG
jgi:hypothetical protein